MLLTLFCIAFYLKSRKYIWSQASNWIYNGNKWNLHSSVRRLGRVRKLIPETTNGPLSLDDSEQLRVKKQMFWTGVSPVRWIPWLAGAALAASKTQARFRKYEETFRRHWGSGREAYRGNPRSPLFPMPLTVTFPTLSAPMNYAPSRFWGRLHVAERRRRCECRGRRRDRRTRPVS